MRYALNLADDGRILSVTFEEYACDADVLVDELPTGEIVEYRYIDGEFIHDPSNTIIKERVQEKIVELKQKLSDTDYNIIKVMEGAATLTEMADIIAKRALWRKEINELEKDLE